MTLPRAAGERDALIIPFPLHRVRQANEPPEDPMTEPEHAAPVTALPGLSDREPPTASGDEEEERAEGGVPARQQRRARNVSLHALAARGHSRWEIEQRLSSRDLSPEVIAEELEALERSGLIDDEALAAELVDKYAIRGGLGRRGVVDKLRSRKIPEHMIEQALLVLKVEDESDALRELALSKLRSVESLAPAVAKRRLGAFLLRKGYSPGDVYPLVSELIR
jgi:regulatory protein